MDGTGYVEQQIEPGRYRVSFRGNSLTPRATVENYLLYRAAEITLQSGHERFRVVRQDTESRTVYHTMTSLPVGAGWGAFPYYTQPYVFGPALGTAVPETSYEAFATIRVVPRDAVVDGDETYDARAVQRALGPRILR